MKTCVSSIRAQTPARRELARLPFAIASAFGAAALVHWPSALAQGLPSLQETVVTAARVPQPLSDVVSDVSIIDRATIERSGAVGVADVLARLPGVEITRNGGTGNTASVYLRGAETRFTAVYLDGVRVDSQSTGGATWEAIPLSQIDRIEVLRGPAAAVYGSDAIGGVIQLFTRRGEGKPAPYAGIGFGSYGLRRVEAGVSGAAGEGGAFDYSIGVAHEENKGFNIQPLEKRTPSKDGFTSPDKDGYNSTSGNVRLGYQINAVHRLETSLLYSDTEARYDVAKFGSTPPAVFPDDISTNRLQTVGAAWIAKWNEIYTSRVQVTDSDVLFKTRPSIYQTETKLRGYLFQNEFRFGPHLLTAALERREDHLDNPATPSTSTELDRHRSQNAASVGYGFAQGPHTLQLHARHDDDSEFGGKTTGSAAYGYAITPTLRATASAGSAFRVPTLFQRFSQYGVPTLKPEESRNYELGLHYADGPTTAGIVAYRNRVTNLITFDGSATGCASGPGCYANTARAVYEGVTLSGGHRIGDVTLRASVDVQNPRDLDTGNQLARRARRHASLGADWRVAGWTLGAEVLSYSRRYDDAANTRPLGGYTLLNLVASTQLTRDISLIARIDNAGNKDYMLARGYATAGRSGYVGIKWTPQ